MSEPTTTIDCLYCSGTGIIPINLISESVLKLVCLRCDGKGHISKWSFYGYRASRIRFRGPRWRTGSLNMVLKGKDKATQSLSV